MLPNNLPDVAGAEWRAGDVRKDGVQYRGIHLEIVDTQKFAKAYPTFFQSLLSGQGLKVRCQRIARECAGDLPRAAELIFAMVRGESRRGGSRVVYVAVDGSRHTSAEAAAEASRKALADK